MVLQAILIQDLDRAAYLNKHFGFTRELVYRAEHLIYHELVKLVPELKTFRRALDQSVLSKIIGKQKDLTDPRPDYYHYHDATNMALHGELDETTDHEDSDQRLSVIAHHAGCGLNRTYVFRINAQLYTVEKAMCRRVLLSNHGIVYYRMTEHGLSILEDVAMYLKQCIGYMKSGVVPDGSSERPFKKYFNV